MSPLKKTRSRLIAFLTLLAVCLPWVSVAAKETEPEDWFTVNEINDEIFERINGKSYKEGCRVPLEELRYLTVAHWTPEGTVERGELICNRSIASDLIDIFRNLYEAGYPIERMRLIDEYGADDVESMLANNTSCFNFRRVAGSKTLSRHSLGLAIDINPLYNPCLYTRSGKVSPANGKAYAHNRAGIKSCPFPVIDRSDLCYRLFTEHGFIWGGGWRYTKDYQHFEKASK